MSDKIIHPEKKRTDNSSKTKKNNSLQSIILILFHLESKVIFLIKYFPGYKN